MKSRGKASSDADYKALLKRATSSKSHARNLDNFKLLTIYEPFQEEVAHLRSGLGINTGGFTTDEEIRGWQEHAVEESEIILTGEDFNRKVQQVDAQAKAGKITPTQKKQLIKMLNELLPVNTLDAATAHLIERFRLPLHYNKALEWYLLRNTISAPEHNYKPLPIEWRPRKVRSLPIAIYTSLTRDELDELVAYIEWFSTMASLPEYQILHDVERDMQIKAAYDDYQKRKRRPVSERGTLADIAEEYLGDRTRAGQISAIVRDLKKTQVARFEPMRKKRT